MFSSEEHPSKQDSLTDVIFCDMSLRVLSPEQSMKQKDDMLVTVCGIPARETIPVQFAKQYDGSDVTSGSPTRLVSDVHPSKQCTPSEFTGETIRFDEDLIP